MNAAANNRSLAILTWRAPVTLARTLKALEPITHLFGERLVVCQESDPEEIRLAEQAGYTAIGTEENLGIQGGLKHAVKSAKAKRVLLLENDCHFLGDADDFERLLDKADQLMDVRPIRFVKMFPHTDKSTRRFLKYWRLENGRLKRRLRGHLRRTKSDLLLCAAIRVTPAKALPSHAIKPLGDSLFLTDSRYCPWSNRTNYLDRDFFLSQIVAFAEKNPTKRTFNGKPDLEHCITSSRRRAWWGQGWWRQQRFPILDVHPDFFGHFRLDRPENDEKRLRSATENWMPKSESTNSADPN